MTEGAPTRERLLIAGLRLFAERGYDRVSVGDVEKAVGLVPRRGALYRHFASKEALLTAAVRRDMEAYERAGVAFETPRGGLLDQAVALGRRTLRELDIQRDIVRVLERDGHRLPEVREEFRTNVADRGYAIVAVIVRSWLEQVRGTAATHASKEAPGFDADATAVLLAGALVNVRRAEWTFGRPPGGVGDEALVRSWASLCVAAVTGAAAHSDA
ncbi:TetR/AcrR family transcriptional regulator [Streptomyces sp. NPDC050418]|uniref:TetR/AcrR family transcriptional regulator n=1 Tax=Streptomyces sp. NPDC050418 TaxID=3365612 RepID=UPI003792E83F